MTESILPRLAALGVIASLGACSTVADLPTERIGSATLSLSNGVPAGTAQLLAAGDTVTLTIAATGISEGAHGFHLHTTGQCTRPDFTSAGGHLNPLGRKHGSLDPDGKHLGDLPNLVVGSGGSGTVTADLEGSRSDIENWLFDNDGTAVVIHAGPDDYRTDPSGDAGSRIACGVLKRR